MSLQLYTVPRYVCAYIVDIPTHMHTHEFTFENDCFNQFNVLNLLDKFECQLNTFKTTLKAVYTNATVPLIIALISNVQFSI